MDVPTIIEELAFAERLPEEAIRAAREQRAEVAPALIALVERYLAGEVEALLYEEALFWAFHLLGEWREKDAYRPLARLLALDRDVVEDILGEATTETVHRVMVGLFDGDPQPLYDVIDALDADPFVRSRMLETLAMLVVQGALARAEALRFLSDAVSSPIPSDDAIIWHGWASAVAALRLEELTDLVRGSFAKGLIDPLLMEPADFEAAFRYACEHPEAPWDSPKPDEFMPFGNVLVELADWHFESGLDEALEVGEAEDEEDWARDYRIERPAMNPLKAVGRNDPCPCGSGKKFKKCCLV